MKQMQIVVKNTNTRENLQNLHYMLDFSDTSGHLRTFQSIICGQLMNYSKIQSTCVRKAKTHTFKRKYPRTCGPRLKHEETTNKSCRKFISKAADTISKLNHSGTTVQSNSKEGIHF